MILYSGRDDLFRSGDGNIYHRMIMVTVSLCAEYREILALTIDL